MAYWTVVCHILARPSVWEEPAGGAPGEGSEERVTVTVFKSFEFSVAPTGLGNVVGPSSSPSPAQSLSSWILLIRCTAATPPCCPLWWRTPASRRTLWWTPTGVQLLKPLFSSYLSIYI